MTELCDLAFRYGTDKCPKLGHSYTPVYYELLKDKRLEFKKVLELGIGSRLTMRNLPKHYQDGASLRMWRDFFPNAQIYGVDKDPSCMFTDDRITTFHLNIVWRANMRVLIKKIGKDLDLVIDDANHKTFAQFRLLKFFLPLLDDKVIYIVEDSKYPDILRDFAQGLGYKATSYKFSEEHSRDTLVMVRKK